MTKGAERSGRVCLLQAQRVSHCDIQEILEGGGGIFQRNSLTSHKIKLCVMLESKGITIEKPLEFTENVLSRGGYDQS